MVKAVLTADFKIKFIEMAVFFSFFISLFYSALLMAHPIDVVYFEIEKPTAPGFSACMSIHPAALRTVLKTEVLSDELFRQANPFQFKTEAAVCKNNYRNWSVVGAGIRLCFDIVCEGKNTPKAEVVFTFLAEVDDLFTVIGKLKNNHSEQIFNASKKNDRFILDMDSLQLGHFFMLGLEHIGASHRSWQNDAGGFQIADGIDHVLFLLALLLVSISLRSLVINITGFTIGHSLSLALSLSHLLVLPAAYIEPAIALSIAYLALKGVRNKKEDSLVLTVAFGFLHGMGFSYILQNISPENPVNFLKTLFMFNIGIEAGQLIILLIFAPVFIYLYKDKPHAKALKISLSLVIFLLSLFWSAERIIALVKSLS